LYSCNTKKKILDQQEDDAMNDVPVVRNIWWMAMWSQDLAPDALVARRIMDEPLVFFRDDDGRPTALQDRCAHRWAPLSRGKITADGGLQCPYHGLEYDRHGICVRNPHPNYKIPPAMRVRSYPLAEKHSMIWIWMGTGQPDESRIPDFGWLDPGVNPIDRRAYLPMPCSWDLMVDNLLDVSHIAFLHDGNLGNPHMVDSTTTIEPRSATCIEVQREFKDIPPSMFWDVMTFNRFPRMDNWIHMTWNAPSCLANNAFAKPAGGSDADGTGILTSHFLTPETATTCHYHFAAMRVQPIVGTPEQEAYVMEQLAEVRRRVFVEEDGMIISAQLERMREAEARSEPLRPVLISADAGVERAHRILRQLYDEEQSQPIPTGA
jgi:vanillate O-demethylase monooxygenase subunit